MGDYLRGNGEGTAVTQLITRLSILHARRRPFWRGRLIDARTARRGNDSLLRPACADSPSTIDPR